MRKLLITLTIIFTILASSAMAVYEVSDPFARPEQGITANTLIAMTTVTADYTSSSNAKVATADVLAYSNVTVDPIYGFDIELVTPGVTVNGIEEGDSATYDYTIANVGNTLVATYNVVTAGRVSYPFGGADSWLLSDDEQLVLNRFTSSNFRIVHEATPTAEPYDRVSMDVRFEEEGRTSEPEWYIGYNGNLYGGYVSINQLIQTWIQVPDIRITKSYTVTINDPAAPRLESGDVDFIPGATIVFTITYENIGSADGAGVEFTDYIPTTNTDFELLSTAHYTSGAVVATWAYSTTTAPTVWSYVPSEHGPYGLINPTVAATGVDADLYGIKIGLTDVPAGDRGTINYSVIIE